jgi:ABC-2 type transport system ATP-binding protein
MKVPFETPNVLKGTFETSGRLPSPSCMGPLSLLVLGLASLVRATSFARVGDGQDGSVPGRPGGRASLVSSSMEATIEVVGLRKRFGGTTALDGMSFTVGAGQVTGFVGPNGAGKSTTMRVILGLDAADSGRALVGGRPYPELRRPLAHVGSLLDAGALQPSRSARNHLMWLAHSQGIPAKRVDEVIQITGIGSAARRKAGGFSLGMRQRLGIAAALLGDPPILMLDEPFNGMDPEGIVWMRTFLRQKAGEGRAVLVSSHLMSELQDTADHLVVVGRGKVIADASVAELITAASGDRVTLRTSARNPAMTVLGQAGATVVLTGTDTVIVDGLTAARVVTLLNENTVPFAEVTAHRASLEEAYMELTREAVEFRAGEPA